MSGQFYIILGVGIIAGGTIWYYATKGKEVSSIEKQS